MVEELDSKAIEIKPLNSNEPYILIEIERRDMDHKEMLNILRKKYKSIRFAGIKDKKAVIRQYATIKSNEKVREETIIDKDKYLKIRILGKIDRDIDSSLIKNNHFYIRIYIDREINKEINLKNFFVVNYFDDQRFSTRNIEIGRLLLQRDYVNAWKIYSSQTLSKEEALRNIKRIDKWLLKMFTHSYQSWLWNKIVNEFLKRIEIKNLKTSFIEINHEQFMAVIIGNDSDIVNLEIPLPGYGLSQDIERLRNSSFYEDIKESLKIIPKEFKPINKQLPFISIESINRKLFMRVKNFFLKREGSIIETEFTLSRGSYATIVVKHLMSQLLH